jgi:thiamine-phosphate pyrophosphorylase
MTGPPKLPHLLVLTDGEQTGGRTLVETVRLAIDGGAKAVILREKRSTTAERRALAAAIRPLVAAAGGTFLVASDLTIEADGVHLSATDPFPAEDRPGIVGRSCHGLADIRRAAGEGCDYATLSPIFATTSKPGYGPALGLDGLRDVVDDFELGTDDAPAAALRADGKPMPVYALGGIDVELAGVCLRAGARGVAVMGSIMRAADPSVVAHGLAHAVRDCDCGQLDAVPVRRPFDDTLDVAHFRQRHNWQLGEASSCRRHRWPSRSPAPIRAVARASKPTSEPSPPSACTVAPPSPRSPRRTPTRSAACTPSSRRSSAPRSKRCSTTSRWRP